MAKLVSSVYGDALFELAIQKNNLDGIYLEIEQLQQIFKENVDLSRILESPRVTGEEKMEILDKIFLGKASTDVLGLLKIVVEKGRQSDFPSIFEYFIARYKEERRIGIAHVKSAIELSEQQKQSIVDKLLETTTYIRFEMHYEVDKSLIGGLVIRIKDRIIDSSVKSKIQDMERKLMGIKI